VLFISYRISSILLVNLYLCLSDHAVNQTNESAERVVVLAGEPQHAGLELVLLFLKNHRLVLVNWPILECSMSSSSLGDRLSETT
jgi:hypothetical protein